MAFSVAIEISQLYHAPWIDSIRRTTLGGLILGFGFLWSDLACYAVGVGLGVIIEVGASALTKRIVQPFTEPSHAIDPIRKVTTSSFPASLPIHAGWCRHRDSRLPIFGSANRFLTAWV